MSFNPQGNLIEVALDVFFCGSAFWGFPCTPPHFKVGENICSFGFYLFVWICVVVRNLGPTL
jgi:hypothetical protein